MPSPKPIDMLSTLRLNLRIILFSYIAVYAPYSQAESTTDNITQISVSCDNWPNTCNKDGSGLYFELLHTIYQPEGIRIKHRIDPFMRGLKLAEEHRVDAMAAAYKTPEREQRFIFPQTRFITAYTSVLYKRDSKQDGSPLSSNKIKGRISIVRGYNYSSHIDETANIEEIGSVQQGIKMVMSGRSDYFINAFYDSYSAMQQLAKTENERITDKVHIEIIDAKPIYLVFPKSPRGQALADMYDKNMQQLFNSGALKAFFDNRPRGNYYYYFPELGDDHALPQFKGF
tara:strand:+ start:2003 stop:2860 length:858 start_codon:yes stop_codon:yes gene_type:complete